MTSRDDHIAELQSAYTKLDANWSRIHAMATDAIRAALGLPDATVPEMVAKIEALKAVAKAATVYMATDVGAPSLAEGAALVLTLDALAKLDTRSADTMATLDCDHCGGIAILSPDGSFGDGDGEACATCGHPGHVVVDQQDDDDGNDTNIAYWSVSEGAADFCNEVDCDDCKERGR